MRKTPAARAIERKRKEVQAICRRLRFVVCVFFIFLFLERELVRVSLVWVLLKFNPTKPKCFKPTYTNIESTNQLLRRISFTKKEFQRVSLCSTEMPSNGH